PDGKRSLIRGDGTRELTDDDTLSVNEIPGTSIDFDSVNDVDSDVAADPYLSLHVKDPVPGSWTVRARRGPEKLIGITVHALGLRNEHCVSGEIVPLSEPSTSWNVRLLTSSQPDSCSVQLQRSRSRSRKP